MGEYAGAANSWTFRLKGRTLVIDIPGAGTFTLLPDGNEGFTAKEQPTTSIQFVTGNDGKVDEFVLSAPEGVFNFKRKAK